MYLFCYLAIKFKGLREKSLNNNIHITHLRESSLFLQHRRLQCQCDFAISLRPIVAPRSLYSARACQILSPRKIAECKRSEIARPSSTVIRTCSYTWYLHVQHKTLRWRRDGDVCRSLGQRDGRLEWSVQKRIVIHVV